MKTKNYLFASAASTLFLLLVVPLLSSPESITAEAVSVATLSIFSLSVGGLVAEAFGMLSNRRSNPRSKTNAKRYFMSVVCSSLFFTVVAPSMTLAIDSRTFINFVSSSSLLALSLGIGGLTTDGLFLIFSSWASTTSDSTNEKEKIQRQGKVPSESEIVDALLGRKVGGK